MKSLGLPKSLYNEPAKKSKVKLVKVYHLEKYESEDEIKYCAFLFLKKKNVEDILVIKVSFVLDKRNIDLERNFTNIPSETNIVLEEIFMIGYMTNTGGVGQTGDRDKFYHFDNLEKDGMMDDMEIIKQLNKKMTERHKETQRFDDTMEPQFRNIKLESPSLTNYNSFQSTQTIYDDMTNPRNYN